MYGPIQYTDLPPVGPSCMLMPLGGSVWTCKGWVHARMLTRVYLVAG